MARTAIVLAAGKGTRMKSELPKVLSPVLGRAMVRYVVDALREAGLERILLVVGYRADLVRAELQGEHTIEFVEQTQQLGTGHAVMMCKDLLVGDTGSVLIVTGDSPLIQVSSIRALHAAGQEMDAACVLGTADKENPAGLGRIVRDSFGAFQAIVEDKDATPEQKEICEVNMSTYLFRTPELLHALGLLTNQNAQKEYYITDCPGILKKEGKNVQAVKVLQPCEALSINTPEELKLVEEEMLKMGYRDAR